jgi:hypothetical protein
VVLACLRFGAESHRELACRRILSRITRRLLRVLRVLLFRIWICFQTVISVLSEYCQVLSVSEKIL